MDSARRFGIGLRIIYNIRGKAMRESLENVKVGDKVVVHRRSGDVIGTVHRVTQTMIMVGNNRFKKKNGDMVGGSSEYWFCYITIPEDGEVEMVKKKMFISDIANDAIKKISKGLTYEQAVKIKEVLGL